LKIAIPDFAGMQGANIFFNTYRFYQILAVLVACSGEAFSLITLSNIL
jgi:hypothetical protein